MSKFKTWKELEKELNFTPEEDEEMKLELDIIKTLIEVRKNTNLTQRELSEKTGIKQPSIAKIESLAHSPQTSTLIKLLYPMGYTLKIVPLGTNKK
ncbi:MAG: helix-turn-helix transcriptional regulator [Clostridia bacterium]|nr:helix-turn-helix transcriptional regulator [Clostridia bacterium]